MKRISRLFTILILAFLYSCSSGGGDDGMTPTPNPQPKADFTVRTATKTASHPWANKGHSVGYTINGIEALTLTLTRGTTYVFEIQTSGHPFYISTDEIGASAGEVTDGIVGSMTENGTLRFTPNSNHPDLLYYQCGIHQQMGYIINIVDP
ncbi:hypothetical protein [Ancylomarina longa]|uniref:At5g54830-like domain-containing protein n=1 Tax=Ancylomarina longa TaxID=2487017 RepID=A0A434ATX9_9BACT|nr:hypothetical protein [Ancylomarina longa]RUT77780.1 hypothetical protein DLK05_11295 [Ancylomarina longa]